MRISDWSSDVCSSDLKQLRKCLRGWSGHQRLWVLCGRNGPGNDVSCRQVSRLTSRLHARLTRHSRKPPSWQGVGPLPDYGSHLLGQLSRKQGCPTCPGGWYTEQTANNRSERGSGGEEWVRKGKFPWWADQLQKKQQ